MFTRKYKRKPKEWSIDQIHDLWVRAKERADKKQLELSNYIKEIAKEIPANEKGGHIVYFYNRHDKSGRIYQYNLNWSNEYKSYMIGSNPVDLKTRDEKLTFILSNDKQFEMGQKFDEIYHNTSRIHYRVREILWRIVEEKLQNKFKDAVNIPDIFPLQIGNKKYYIALDEQHRYGWKKFHLKNECDDEVFSI